MHRLYVDRPTMMDFFSRLQVSYAGQGNVYLVGESIQVFEGWSDHTRCLDFFAEVDPVEREGFAKIVRYLSDEIGITVREESPSDVIPLPKGFRERARPASGGPNGPLAFFYFDPYSVAFRLITRGDEPDYRAVLIFLEKGWISVEMMNGLLSGLLPQFSKETISQDPAEFRRKYRGLLQMWQAIEKGRHGAAGQKIVK